MSTENTALITRPNAIIGVNMRELKDVADMIFSSKVFGDLQTKEAACVKILAGMEKGFTPFQSMSMFDFIQGRPTLNAHGKATLINSSGDFRLKIKELTNTKCVIDVCRKNDSGEWKVINTNSFTWEDAVTAGYTTGKNGHSYKNTPRNMLFARCVSNIWRWDCAELETRKTAPDQIKEFSAPELEESDDGPDQQPYVDAEPAEQIDYATGEVIDAEPLEEIDTEESQIETLKLAIRECVSVIGQAKYEQILNGRRESSMDKKALAALFNELNA